MRLTCSALRQNLANFLRHSERTWDVSDVPENQQKCEDDLMIVN